MKDFGGIKSAGLLIKKQSARYLSNKSMEMVFLVIVLIQKINRLLQSRGLKWTMPLQNWKAALNCFTIMLRVFYRMTVIKSLILNE
jgi:hypothetical protein